MSMRVGLGFDVHRLVEGRPCILGGVDLGHDRGPLGHSDGDAVLHAVTDAVLSAAGLDDLGTLYSDKDPRWKGANSADLLRDALELVTRKGFRVVNVDVVVATEGPRIAPHRARMRERMSTLLGIEPDAVNVKGKTLEGLGAFAHGAAVVVQAVALLERSARP